MKRYYTTCVLILFVFLCAVTLSGQTKRVLFLGNSYTHGNGLPEMLSIAASSAGKTLISDMHAPGGYYVHQHLTDATALAKITEGNWDHVVLQDQSMSMAYPDRHIGWMPYYVAIDSIIKSHNLCVQTMLFSTWGRKNGDTYLCTPPQCETDTWIVRNYYQMDTDIEMNYKRIADSIKSSMTPVGATWRNIRQNYPSIELFAADESHPSMAGTYAAACAFYATIFRSDPTSITFDGWIPAADAANIRMAAKNVVYDHLVDWNVGLFDELLDVSCLGLGIDENEFNDYWRVAPNPVADVLRIRFNEDVISDKIVIYNMHGRFIKEINATNATSIDFTELPSGLYLLKSMKSNKTFKLVKK